MKRVHWRRLLVLLVAGSVVAGLSLTAQPPAPAAAITGSEFDPSNIVSDANFYDRNALSEAEIQAFLDGKIGTCTNGKCLNVLTSATALRTSDRMCAAGYVPDGAPERISRIIFKVQQSCGISAKAILVMLQKEQGLVTKTAPSDGALRAAMGYGCPDTAACDSTYYGIFNQIYQAARQLKRYGLGPPENTSFTWFPVGAPSAVRWHPNVACGASTITIQNKATAALYYYTPYQPNAAALANLRGTGDACSSYGNRNFWVFYNDWFGPPVYPAGTPQGELADIVGIPGGVRVTGWAVDPNDIAASVPVAVQIASTWHGSVADDPSTAADTAFPGAGPNHGFDLVLPAAVGTVRVCVTLVNAAGAGGNMTFTCRFVNVPATAPPVGEVAVTTAPGSVTVSGWAARADVPTTPLAVAAQIGQNWYALTTGLPNTVAPSRLAGAGPNQGYASTITVPAGTHQICVWAPAANGPAVSIGCQVATVPASAGPPEGEITSVAGGVGQLVVSGWALQPATPGQPVTLAINIGSQWIAATADLATPTSSLDPSGRHGFSVMVPLPSGTHTACLWISSPQGAVQRGCASGTVIGAQALGELESMTAVAGGISFSGWAVRPESPSSPVGVAVNVGSQWIAYSTGAAHAVPPTRVSGAGANQGFSGTVSLPAGQRTACVWISGATGAVNLGCRTVTVPSVPPPVGAVTTAAASSGTISFSGWAVRPDVPTAQVPVAVNIGSRWIAFATATPSPAAQAAVIGAGPNQGISGTFSAPSGRQTFCIWAHDANGVAVNMGCSTVVVP